MAGGGNGMGSGHILVTLVTPGLEDHYPTVTNLFEDTSSWTWTSSFH